MLIVCNLFCNCNTFSLLDIIIWNRVILFETRCMILCTNSENWLHVSLVSTRKCFQWFLMIIGSWGNVFCIVTKLGAGRSGVQISVGVRDFFLHNVQSGSGAYPTSYSVEVVSWGREDGHPANNSIPYNKNQQDGLFLNFILVNNSTWSSIPTSLADCHITSMTNTYCCEYSIKTPDDVQ